MKNKKSLIILGIVVLVIVLLLILRVNIKNNNSNSKKNNQSVEEKLIEDVNVNYKEGMYLDSKDEYIEFEIKGNSKTDIIYDINIKEGKEENNKTRIEDKNIKFTLMKKVNETEYATVVENQSYENIKEYYRMYIDVMPKGENIVHTYKLYMKTDNNDNNKYANIEVKVNGNVTTDYKPIG